MLASNRSLRLSSRIQRAAAAALVLALAMSATVVGQEIGTPPGDDTPPPLVADALVPGGPRVAVIAYCSDTTGSVGGANVQAYLVAANQFSVVDLIDGDVAMPTSAFLLANYDAVLAATDNRCGSNSPILDAAGLVLAEYENGGGGLVLTSFGFSDPNGIGFGPDIFAAGLSPLTPNGAGNGPAGTVDIAGASATPPCDALLAGVGGNFGSSYANQVALAAGATQCASYTNGSPFLAVNANQSIVAINGFPFVASDIADPDYTQVVVNALLLVLGPGSVVGGYEIGSVDWTVASEARAVAVSSSPALLVALLVAIGLFGVALAFSRRKRVAGLEDARGLR